MAERPNGKARGAALAVAVGAGLILAAGSVRAEDPGPAAQTPALRLSFQYTADVSGVVSGGLTHRGRYLDDLQFGADADLGRLFGWKGAAAHVTVLNNSGGAPNEDSGSLQGVDNIEVSLARARLFEAWIEQSLADGRGSVLAGLYDVNSEFYANDSAGLLLAPAFGIGSELAATGPNGPSIFPSTALAIRGRWSWGETVYLQGAALNGHAGVPGDPSGVDTGFGEGALLIAEAGWTGRGKLAVGAWRYTRRQDGWRELTPAGDPARRTAQGAYVLADHPFFSDAARPRRVTGFARVGISDGATTPFSGGWQAGVLINQVFDGRPNSAASIGFNQAFISDRERANGRAAGRDIGPAESGFEVTYSDALTEHLSLQPDLQYVRRPAGDRHIGDAVVVTLRLRVAY